MSQVGVLPIWVVLIAAMIGAGIVGIVVELVAFRPLGRKQLHITPLITTIAVAFVLQEAAVKLFGSEQRSFPVPMFDQLQHARPPDRGLPHHLVQMFIIGASLVLMVGLYLFVEKTKMGKAMRACAENTHDGATPRRQRPLDHGVDLRHRLGAGRRRRRADRARLQHHAR